MNIEIKNYLHGPYRIGNGEWVKEPPSMKWLPGDIVNSRGDVTFRNHKLHNNIVGIVDFVNKTGQGFSPRGIPLYLFYPYNSAYPPFIVASKQRYIKNKIALINCEHWDEKWPRGGIVTIIGDVGDLAAERAAQFLRIPRAPKYEIQSNIVWDDIHEFIEYDECFNIDPVGCKDVDDIFAWRTTSEGITEFVIGIADVSAFVKPGTPIDITAAIRGQTVYDKGCVKIPMIDTAISAGSASLLVDGDIKPLIALVFNPAPHWRLIKTYIKNSYTYDNVPPTIYSKLVEYLQTYLHKTPTDTHTCVEMAMITYNSIAATILRAGGKGLLRIHNGFSDLELNRIAELTGCDAIKFIGASAGHYISAANSAFDTEHSGLGLSEYTHASSPLRRYSDLLNQRAIKYLLFGCLSPIIDLDTVSYLNKIEKLYKSIDREIWLLDNLTNDVVQTTYAYCLKCKDYTIEREIWSVYIPAWRKTVKAVCTLGDSEKLEVGKIVNISAIFNLKNPQMTDRFVCSIDGIVT